MSRHGHHQHASVARVVGPRCYECRQSAHPITRHDYFAGVGTDGLGMGSFPLHLSTFWYCFDCDRYGARTFMFG